MDELLFQVEDSSQSDNIFEADMSTSPKPFIAVMTNSAVRISYVVGKESTERSNEINEVVDDKLLFAVVLLPMTNPFPFCELVESPSSR